MRLRLAFLASVALSVLLLLAACGGNDDSQASPAEMVIGTWEFPSETFATQMQVNEDGSYAFSIGPSESTRSIDDGQYEIEGDSITFRTDESPYCGGTGQYQMTFNGADAVNFELVEDECAGRANDLGSSRLVRISDSKATRAPAEAAPAETSAQTATPGAAQEAMSLTLSGDECAYPGPTQVSEGEGDVVIVVDNRNDAEAIFTAFPVVDEVHFQRFAEEIDEKRAVIEAEGEVGALLTTISSFTTVDVGPGESGELSLSVRTGNHYALSCANFVGEKPFNPFTNKITVWGAAGPLEVTE